MWFDRGVWPAWVAWGALTSLLAVALLLVATASAWPRMHHPARGHRILPGGAPPLDGFTQPSGAYSFRQMRTAYTGPAVRIRRASDNLELDINFLGFTGFTGAPWDAAAASAHCAATTCFLAKWYDQSGNARDWVQATAANQPQLIFNCTGSLPCGQTTTGTQSMGSVANVTPATGIASFSAVANRVTVATGACYWISGNGGTGNRLQSGASNANNWNMIGGASGQVNINMSSNAWHSVQAVLNGASSVANVDGGADITGQTATGNTTAGAVYMVGAAGLTCNRAELVVWDNYTLTSPERAALQANQKSFWGTP